MERSDLEFGEVELIQDTVQSLLDCAENEDINHSNRLSPSIYMAPEIMLSTKMGHIDMIQDSVVQHLLHRVKIEDHHMNRISPSIYMAPGTLRDLSPTSFDPRVVSIGPLHRKDENVQAFEGRKASYLTNLLRRIKSPEEETLKSCVQKVYTSMEQIKACYVWTKIYNDAEISDMMVMDACFILEFLFKIWSGDVELYKEGKLLFQNVLYDLVLLENQIPLFILDEIFQCTILKFNHDISLVELVHPVLATVNLFNADIKVDNISYNNTHHILSLLHQCYKPPDNITKGAFGSTIPSGADLDRLGVKFKPNKDSTWLMGMEMEIYRFPCYFGSWSKPTLRIPVLKVHDHTEFVLRNLIAYEQTFETDNHVSSYAIAMDMLVDTREDVVKLVDSRVLLNSMGSNEQVANIINNICKEVVLVDFYYEQQWVKLSKYSDGYWQKNMARMRKTYFSSPWSMIALLAGIILFALTVVQTIFTIKSVGNNE